MLNNLYEYTGMFIIAAQDGTTVSVDVNGDGDSLDAVDVNTTLNQGQSLHIDGGIMQGATVTASANVGVNLITGDRDSGVDSRWYMLKPRDEWFSSYISPAGSVGSATTSTASLILVQPACDQS